MRAIHEGLPTIASVTSITYARMVALQWYRNASNKTRNASNKTRNADNLACDTGNLGCNQINPS
jgi:hypothetical protein